MTISAPNIPELKQIRAVPNSTRRKLKTRWAWRPYAPLGEVTLVTGATDLGKSTLCIDLAAALTRGELPGDFHGTPVNICYVALEDTVENDVAPKVEATDGNRDRWFDLEVDNGWLYLPQDLKMVAEKIDETSAKALFLDPITSVVQGDKNKAHEVRPVMEAIRKMAAQKGIAVFGIIHQRKGNSGSATEGVMGTAEWVNVARSVLAVKENKEQPGQFILSIGKGNRAPREERQSLSYTFDHRYVEYDDDDEPLLTPKIKWIGATDISVDDLMEASASGSSIMETEGAVTWLRALLDNEGGEILTGEAYRLGRSNGLSKEVVDTAAVKLRLGRGFQGTGITFVLPNG